MARRFMRLFAAALLVVGLVSIPGSSSAAAKSKKTEKAASHDSKKKSGKASSKSSKNSKSSKKTSKRDTKGSKNSGRDRNAKKGRDDRRSKGRKEEVAKSSHRGKSVQSTKSSRHDEDVSSRARRTSPVVTKRTVDQFDDDDDGTGDDAEEPAGPKPANRVVADISPNRVMQIQSALIGKGLMTGPANGVYDQPTFQAMAAFQTRNGWNPVGVPTADSLKALGVPKNSGRGFMTPASVVEATAPPQR